MNRSPNERHGARGGERLYRVIGEIDDRFIAEAIAYRSRAKRRRPALHALAALAACLAVVLLLRLVPLIHLRGGDKTPDGGAKLLWEATEGYSANSSLLSTLAELSVVADTSDAPPATDDGCVRIVWRDEATGVYYAVTLDRANAYELERLRTMIRSSTPAASLPADGAPPPYLVWISTGTGTAVSPYLSYADGTLFYGTPGAYAPEQLPAEQFAALLEELLRAEAPVYD